MTESNQEQAGGREPLVYRDFNLRFGRYIEVGDGGTLEVWVEGECPGGAMRPADAAPCRYDPGVFWQDPLTARGGLLGGLERRRLGREEMFQLGRLLADLALPEGAVRSLFERSLAALGPGEGLRLRLHVDPLPLVHLPWEYLALPQASGEPKDSDFLALRREISIVRTDTVESVSRQLPDRAVARVVGVFSSPDDQKELDVERDKAALKQAVQALNRASGQEGIELVWAERPATRAALGQALSEGADILHYAGHAVFDQAGQLILETEGFGSDFYSGEQLAQLLRGAGVRLVVLGACETGRRDGQNVWSGVAPALARERVPAVLANQFSIQDNNAVQIASQVYHRVLSGFTVDEALYEARQAIYQHKGLENRDWGVVVLYLNDAGGVLFPLPQAGAQEEPIAGRAFLRLSMRLKRVAGSVVNAEVNRLVAGQQVEIHTEIDDVQEGGEVLGVRIG